MKDSEKIDWMRAFMALWGMILALIGAASVGAPQEDALPVMRALLLMAAGGTLIGLLILSWRAAFLSGRKR